VWAPFGSAVADADASSQGPPRAKRVLRMGIEWELMTAQSGRSLVGALNRIVSSSANYWAAMLSDLVAALGFLALGLHRFSGRWVVAAGVVIAGFLSSGLLEYIVHRWVLHGPPSMAKRGHAQHHAEPRALISTPLFVMMTGTLAIWGCSGLCFRLGSPLCWSSGCTPDTTISRSCITCTIAARTSRAFLTCDDSSDSITSITLDRS